MAWLVLVSLGLGVARLVQFAKELWPAMPRWSKGLLSLALSFGLGVFVCLDSGLSPTVALVVGVGVWGLSMVVHQLVAALQSKKDLDRLSVRLTARRR